MAHEFEIGYPRRFAALLRDYPGPEAYPPRDFRVEWGPIFHRGRLDGSARVLVLGQDPAAHETVARRILVGEAGQRVQGLLAKAGIERSYVMVNTFLYSVYGQGGGERHHADEAIAAYRHRWLDLLAGDKVEAILALGGLADGAYQQWRKTPKGAASTAVYVPVKHPTYPESASAAGQLSKAAATKKLLDNWNAALPVLRQAVTPDVETPLVPYADRFTPADLRVIPEADLPPGLPDWMRSLDAWASRQPVDEALGPKATRVDKVEAKRAGLAVRVPRKQRVWHTP
ncbi:MAG TPA: uracil-DNA glycosylase family protein [Acidimicrobiales bacterium]|nr:uracil-DNA glycosylase family protein [Acidimicrobiales bacterium]